MSNIGNKEVFAQNLKYYSDRSGKTQKELAEIANVAPSTFNDWMKAKKYPRIDKIEILANFFNILKSDLIEEKGEKRKEMHKNNDTISDIVVRMRIDNDFFSVVELLNGLDAEKLAGVKQVLSAFLK